MSLHSNPQTSAHLSDDQLVEIHLCATDNQHVRTCRRCRTRLDELADFLGHVREDAVNEADAVFTADRLQEQRARILRRLDRHAHPADVLRFPSRFGTRHAARRLLGPARRWIAGAAVAGLVAGLFLGFAVDRQVGTMARGRTAHADPKSGWRPATVPATLSALATPTRDEQILTEIEDALTGPSKRVYELRTLDAMTLPAEVQEASFVPR